MSNKMEVDGDINCFIALKDHKDNFRNNTTTRLLNPPKNEIGRISKETLNKINVRQTLNLNQCENTLDIIRWFKFRYASLLFLISKISSLLSNNISYQRHLPSRKNIQISPRKIVTLYSTSLLFSDLEAWAKKDNGIFDVTI